MTSEVAVQSALAKWEPEIGPLPEGWQIERISIEHVGRQTAEVTLVRGWNWRHGWHRAVTLLVDPTTKSVKPWLASFLQAVSDIPGHCETGTTLDLRDPFR